MAEGALGEPQRAQPARPTRSGPVRYLTQYPWANVAASGAILGIATMELTAPQIVRLTDVKGALRKYPSGHRRSFYARNVPGQFFVKSLHLGGVRLMHDGMDMIYPSPLNLTFSCGVMAVLFQASAYNMLTATTLRALGVSQGPPSTKSVLSRAVGFYKSKIAPGVVWTFLRDCNSVGGGVVLAPPLGKFINNQMPHPWGRRPEPHPAVKFSAGLLAGFGCGLATQCFHNATLTAGRMAELGEKPNTVSCMRRLFAEQGHRAIYMNFLHRAGLIALSSAVLNMLGCFRAPGSPVMASLDDDEDEL
mmetsp:Transcript_9006/g.10174  ORF Transcript_9006/g.10174 Transcript_9006/m.10174 type:complete len:305 (+) Transcript_9006:37-951(+)|eukprot:CAMPEP_0205821596 /NCGR_PEP_ID=MMETSP0206-20130828/8534_1 /ASSEMBLY_ACC=CAM_ASM_000279 /TAXON_ID=36767 /ORGANISM="Euplotes focardii, Strain TN1" /LENGTH=304 /DNA_ID=CAMNT_0053117179 /DNA_START=37 /DNA_END=951 /DNA_ORIENTATION=+